MDARHDCSHRFGVLVVRLGGAAPALSRGTLHVGQIGLLFCLAGTGAIIFSTAHYFHIQHAIEHHIFQPERRWILTCSLIIITLGVGVIWYVSSL